MIFDLDAQFLQRRARSGAEHRRDHRVLAAMAHENGRRDAGGVIAPPGEFKQLQIDSAEMASAAGLTKGKFYTPATVGTLLADLPEGRQVPIESLEPIVLWNKWPLVFVFTLLLVGEWVLRKRRGLL